MAATRCGSTCCCSSDWACRHHLLAGLRYLLIGHRHLGVELDTARHTARLVTIGALTACRACLWNFVMSRPRRPACLDAATVAAQCIWPRTAFTCYCISCVRRRLTIRPGRPGSPRRRSHHAPRCSFSRCCCTPGRPARYPDGLRAFVGAALEPDGVVVAGAGRLRLWALRILWQAVTPDDGAPQIRLLIIGAGGGGPACRAATGAR